MNSATANQDEVKPPAANVRPQADCHSEGATCSANVNVNVNASQSLDSTSADQLKQAIQDCLQADLEQVNQAIKNQLRSRNPLVAEMVDHVSCYQGKQLRPILLLLIHRMTVAAKPNQPQTLDGQANSAVSKDAQQAAYLLAASVEMIHLATLVHDDVIDEAETRRHVATVHRRWNTESSVLLGDYLFSRAFHLSAMAGDATACALIGKATDRTCEGEFNQMAARSSQSKSELDYFRIIRGKTGQLFGLSSCLGARSAGGSESQQAAAARFGIRLGLAFQIADDILDLTQTSQSTGKDAANDVQNGRRTLPILRALRFASEDEASTLNDLLDHSSADSFHQLKQLPCVAKGIESATQTAQNLIDRASQDLSNFPDCVERQLLASIVQFAIRRNG